MKLARTVFWVACAFGALGILGLYFNSGTQSPIYYSMLATLIPWQIALFMIGLAPKRFRPLMIPAALEKVLWILTLLVFNLRGQFSTADLAINTAVHGTLGILFFIAFVRTK